MEKKRSSRIKLIVIAGYLLVLTVLVIGLFSLYRNLVVFSNNRIKNEDLTELLLVGNTLSKLYEIESDQNLFTAESAQQYFLKFDSIVPEINAHLVSLQQLTVDTSRIAKLDTIQFLLVDKRENLMIVATLLDSIRQAPEITRQLESSYVPRGLNREISDYLISKDFNTPDINRSDTSVVLGERRGFLDRVRNVFVASQDSTIVIESKSILAEKDFRLVVDTIINKVRYSERLNLERQKQFQLAFIQRQGEMSHTNRMLTARIDDLLKGIEQEELRKSLQLLTDKERALSGSQRTMLLVSSLALLIAIIFGILFLIDINKSQRYRRQLEASNKRISDLLASREKLMLTISHDIKAPMSSILGYIELMEDGVEQEKGDLYLGSMKHSGEHVLRLVSTLLDYHKIDSGKWQLNEINFNVNHLVSETVSSFKPLALQKGLSFIDDSSLPPEWAGYGDPYVIRQILSNIISNAIKYTAKGEVKITARAETAVDGNRLIFSVSDTGTGIATADQQDIFREFHRLDPDPDVDAPSEGTGLGLAITKRFTDQLEGVIHLHSEKEKGSEFIVELPIKPPTGVDKYLSGISIDESTLENVSVLVVDDEPTQLLMTSEMLVKEKMKCVTETNPDKVFTHLNEDMFDIIFVDIKMPRLNGVDLVRKLRSDYPKGTIPIIALSARSDISRSDLQSIGFTDFLTKPFTSQQLYTIIYHYVKSDKKEDLDQSAQFIQSELLNGVDVEGVSALIDFVKDDLSSSCNILQSFIKETKEHIHLLNVAFSCKDYESIASIAHKILPLYRMMREKWLISMLTQLEKEQPLTVIEETRLLDMLKRSVTDAITLYNEIAQN
jgi:signal transduction histidine kinase/FixJ family two-component response regulator